MEDARVFQAVNSLFGLVWILSTSWEPTGVQVALGSRLWCMRAGICMEGWYTLREAKVPKYAQANTV